MTDLATNHDGGSAAIEAIFVDIKVGHSFENLAVRLKVSQGFRKPLYLSTHQKGIKKTLSLSLQTNAILG